VSGVRRVDNCDIMDYSLVVQIIEVRTIFVTIFEGTFD